MISTILHLEDDIDLRESVQLMLEGFGFRGKHLYAGTLAAARELLDDTAREGVSLSLIISDMNLPDGTGLDLIRYVRANPAWNHTPMLILSGDVDPAKVHRAYELGADSYIDKTTPGRLLAEVVTAMDSRWAAHTVVSDAPNETQQFLARAYNHRGRHARVYQRIAGMFASHPGETAFWLRLALSELNATNLLLFLLRDIGEGDIPAEFVEKMDRGADVVEARLTAVERELEQGAMSRARAYSAIIDLLSAMSIEGLASSIDHLFHHMPEPMAAARDFLFNIIRDVARRINANTDDVALRERASQLLTAATAAFARVAAQGPLSRDEPSPDVM